MNEKKNILRDKSFAFAVRIYKLNQYLVEQKKEYVLSKQILRSGTSIGANVREAYNASSKSDFIYKLSIAQKETDETIYWLELLKEVGLLNEKEFESIQVEASELLKIIRNSILTAKKTGKKVFVGQSSRFFEPYKRQRKDFEEGLIGELITIESHYNADHRWFLEKKWALEKSFKWLYGGLSHPVDFIRYYLPNIEEV